MPTITKDRATKIGRSIPCPRCGEYSFKKLRITRADESLKRSLGEAWHVSRSCGVCGAHGEIGLDASGDIVYES
jgi:hypothetical protein